MSAANGSEMYLRLVRPGFAEPMRLLKLDLEYGAASGCRLFPRNGGEPVLDLVGGFGTLFFGHNHPALVEAATDHLASGRPVFTPGAVRPLTGELARQLSVRASGNTDPGSDGDYRVLFANSGTEAVEAALLLARAARDGPVVALEGAFHGRTRGAAELTRGVLVPPNDEDALRGAFRRHRPAALFLELIQGEGGVVPLRRSFVALARDLCRDALLVVDECQTGMGRTGRFLACEHYGLQPDVLLLAKALGGGIAKISAVLMRRDRDIPDLSATQTSTFGDDELSSAVALGALDLLGDGMLDHCAGIGSWLGGELLLLKERFPDVIADVRGLGLMWGIELRRQRRGFLLPALGDDLGLLAAGHLLHRHRVRVLPTLGNPLTLRVQPPVVTPRAALRKFLQALADTCGKIRSLDLRGLTRHFLPARRRTVATPRGGMSLVARDTPTGVPRVGWLFHPIDGDDLARLEPSFLPLSFREREDFLAHAGPGLPPIVIGAADVASRTGVRVRFYAIMLAVTARRVREHMENGNSAWLRSLVESGIDCAEDLGCDAVSLGQYTSIIMKNGLAARPRSLGLTTGNSLALGMGIEAVEREMPHLASCTLAVVGAAGNIGETAARMMAPRFRKVLLVGSDTPGSVSRMRRIGIPGAEISTRVRDCRRSEVVLVAVNSPEPVVGPADLSQGALVLDLSVPSGVNVGARSDVRCIRGGIARLPHGEDLGIPHFPLNTGLAYACMAEGMILGFESIRHRSFTGRIRVDGVENILGLAKKHGFELNESKTREVLGASHAHCES